MPTLSQSLHKYDLSFLRNLARLWGLELPGEKKTTIIEQLTARILDPQYNQPMLQRLSPEARLILEDLTAHQGRLPLAAFARKYGELRRVGAGKRDREAIWRSPQNAAESLWFYGLIFLDFFEGETGIEEFVYLPPDLFPHLPFPVNTQPPQFEAVLSAEQVSLACATQDYLVDDTCTFLAWLRKTQRPSSSDTKLKKHLLLSKEHLPGIPIPLRTEFLQAILSDAGVLDINSSMPLPEPARRFLSLERWQRLAWLYEAWLKSTSLNELRQLEHIEPLGEWENDPRIPRLFITNQLRSLQIEQWYELSPFAQYIHDHYPDFQRPGGNYEVWLIRRRSDQQFLRGFESWFEVEGQLLRYLILGPLLWFGLVEVGVKKGKPASYAFRITQQGNSLLQKQAKPLAAPSDEQVRVLSGGTIAIPRLFAPTVRYQIARFCEWEDYRAPHYLYRITPESLRQAQQQNLKPQQLIRLLQRDNALLPPSVVQAVRRWVLHATEIEVIELPILRVRSADILKRIQKSPCAKHLQQILNPTTAVVKRGEETKLIERLFELGFLADAKLRVKTEIEGQAGCSQPINPPSEK